MLITLAIIGASIIVVWLIRALRLKGIILEVKFDNEPVRLKPQLKSNKKSSKQLED